MVHGLGGTRRPTSAVPARAADGLAARDFHDSPGRTGSSAGIDADAGPDSPLAWIDDPQDDACRAWAAARRGPTLLVTPT